MDRSKTIGLAAARSSISQHRGPAIMTEFTPFLSLFGGSLIGLAAVLLMAFHGRVAGMTGILSGIVPPFSSDWGWRAAFLLGATAAPALMMSATGFAIPFDSPT